MEFQVGDKVIHPKRPEWGVGIVQPPITEAVYNVHFSTSGLKSLRRDLVVLHPWEEGRQEASFKSETQHYRLREVKPFQPAFFKREFVYPYPPAYLNSFLKEDLAREWYEKNTGLFDENDWQYLARNPRKKHHFQSWLGAVLLARSLEWSVLQPSWMFQKQASKQKHLKQCFTAPLLDYLRESFAAHGVKSMPPLIGFDKVYHRKAFIWIKEQGESFLPEQVATTKTLVRDFKVDVYLIRLEKQEKFDLNTIR